MRRRTVSAIVPLAVAAHLAGCAVNPVSGRREFTVVSAQQERALGAEEAKEVAASMGLVEDPKLAAYVRAVGARVAAHSPMQDVDYTFGVVDMPEPNAFALPGGYVYVSRGLLALLNSEDELAGVLGHEVGHVAARHAVQRISRAAPIGIISGVGAAVTGMVSPFLGDMIGGVGVAANSLVLAPYGRDQEREADRVGVELSAKAGWDPAALADSLHTLEREDALSREGKVDRVSFFATHPPLPERVSDVRVRASGLVRGPAASVAASPQAFLRHLDGVVVGPSVAEGAFDGQTFVHPDLDFAVTFPPGWKTQNARDGVGARDPNKEATIVLEAAGEGDDPGAPLAKLDEKTGSAWSKRAERVEIGGRRAVHLVAVAHTDEGTLAVDLTWIAHRGRIFRILGATPPESLERYAAAFRTAARSFRPPTAAERSRVRETRIRLVHARKGDTVASLVERSRSVWKADMVRVANGLGDGEEPGAGRVVKVAVSEPYAVPR